jgi:serine/threonine protein kinase
VAHPDPRRAGGSTFAGQRIDAVLGRGGIGVVFLATDLVLGRRALFERECRLAAAIDHPHAVQIFHAGEEAGLLYLTMRYVDGPDLSRLSATTDAPNPRGRWRCLTRLPAR